MSKHDTNRTGTGPHVAAQVAATWAALDAAHRGEQLAEALQTQDSNFLDAFGEMQRVRDFVGSPKSIRGNPDTKHGEIAEQVTVGVHRAWDALHGRAPTAEWIGANDPVDYRVDGVDIQSKYINALRRGLDHVSSHATKYPDLAQGDLVYHIPRDQHEQIEQLRHTGQIDGFAEKSAKKIGSKLDGLQQKTGRSPDELIQPGEGTYAEVQQGRIHDTIRDREDKLSQKNEELRQKAQKEHGPSLAGLGSAAAIGAAAGGGVRFGEAIWVKCRDGKNPFKGEFSTQDWNDVGVVTAKGASGGAVAGSALYALTNSTDLAAPFAGALVSGLMGVGDILRQYHSGKIDGDQFVESSHIIAADVAIIGLTATAGQVLIPIPMLGAFLGSLAGKIVASAIKDGLGAAESELIERLAAYEKSALEQLDDEFRQYIQRLDAYFGSLERFAQLAFDETVNTTLRLEASIQYAQIVGVTDNLVLHTPKELDTFMTE